MDISNCQHIKIRDVSGNEYPPEEYIKYIEDKYKIDIRAIPQWKELAQRLHVTNTDCKRSIQEAQLRKKLIARKLFLEYTRFTPFELTDRLSRTAKIWEQIELKNRELNRKKIPCISRDLSPSLSSEGTGGIHPNTCVDEAESEPENTLSDGVARAAANEIEQTHLPPNVCINQHKLVSPLPSQYSSIRQVHHHVFPHQDDLIDNESDWMSNPTTSIECSPPAIVVIFNDLNRQFLPFKIYNRSKKFMFIRFKKMTNHRIFKAPHLEPKCPQKMFPGIPINFVFSFKLKDFRDDFKAAIYFRVGYDVYEGIPNEALCVPIVSDFKRGRIVSVPKTVVLPPLYPWHFVEGKTRATFEVSVKDGHDYHLHIVKRNVEHVPECSDENFSSTKVMCSSLETLEAEEKMSATESVFATKSNQGFDKTDPMYVTYFISVIAAEIVDRSLETYYFNTTYVPFLVGYPKKAEIAVYLSKIERTGWHNAYYDFQFIDPRTNDIIISKTMQIFVEVLENPIKMEPNILIMTESPMIQGHCQDKFVIKNTNRIYAADVKIFVTREMKKLFKIFPMKSHIPALSSSDFVVKFCTTDRGGNAQNYVHINIEIGVSGDRRIYHNMRPMYYEIVAPCETYYNHLLTTPTLVVDPIELAF